LLEAKRGQLLFPDCMSPKKLFIKKNFQKKVLKKYQRLPVKQTDGERESE